MPEAGYVTPPPSPATAPAGSTAPADQRAPHNSTSRAGWPSTRPATSTSPTAATIGSVRSAEPPRCRQRHIVNNHVAPSSARRTTSWRRWRCCSVHRLMLTCRALEYQPPAQFPVLSGVSVVLTVAHHFPTDCVTLRHATSSVGNPSFSGQGRLRRPTVDLDDGRGPASMASSAQTGSPTDMRLRCTVPRERRSTRLTTSRTAAAVNVPRSPSPVPATGPAFAHPCRQSGGRRRRPHDAWAVERRQRWITGRTATRDSELEATRQQRRGIELDLF